MKLTDFRIGSRLSASFTILCVMLVLIAGLGIVMLRQMNDGIRTIANEYMPRVEAANKLGNTIGDTDVALRNMLLNSNPADRKRQVNNILERRKIATQILDGFGKTMTSAVDRTWLAQTIAAKDAYFKGQDDLFKLIANEGQNEAQAYLINNFRPLLRAFKTLVAQEIDSQGELARKAGTDAETTYARTRNQLAGLSTAILLFSGLLAYVITRSITRPVAKALAVANTVAAGDLSSQIEVDSKDELGQLLAALKGMNDNLARTVRTLRTGTDVIATVAAEVAAGNVDLSARTEQQASALQETAATMEQITSTVRQNAENARQARTLADAASDVALCSGDAIGRVVQTMGRIGTSSDKIAAITNVIDTIAFQTNLLALNAAVEAARAGEQGRGFAVVAAEVRNLAQRAAGAAREIKGLIDQSSACVAEGSELVEQAGATIDDLVASVRKVTTMVSEITTASAEQTAAIEQVSLAINEMDDMTQQNAALVEQAAAASSAMQEQAGRLAEAARVFKLEASTAVVGAERDYVPRTPALGRS